MAVTPSRASDMARPNRSPPERNRFTLSSDIPRARPSSPASPDRPLPGVPGVRHRFLLNDFAKISATRDAFLLFYDEFPLRGNGIGGGLFNGAQEFAFNKNALEKGLPVTKPNGQPNLAVTVAYSTFALSHR